MLNINVEMFQVKLNILLICKLKLIVTGSAKIKVRGGQYVLVVSNNK